MVKKISLPDNEVKPKLLTLPGRDFGGMGWGVAISFYSPGNTMKDMLK